MKALVSNLTALVFLCVSGRSPADVIYSNLRDIPINLTWGGTTIDLDGISGWEFNPYLGGAYAANSGNFQPARLGTDGMDTILNLGVGTAVNGGLIFASGSGGSLDHLGSQFTAGTEGYLGFKLNGTDYGWMRVVFTNNTAGAVVKDWAYDTSATSIVIGRISQSAADGGSQIVTLSPQSGESFTLGSQITNTGGNINSVLKTGPGATTLTGVNSYTGTTDISNGTLLVNGSLTGGGTVTVAGGATLGGIGSISGALNVEGTLAPGASIESLASGALTFTSGSTFAYEMDSGAAPSVAADFQKVFGPLALTGTVTLDLTDVATSPAAFAPLTTLSLINYAGAWNGGFFTCGGNTLTNGEVFTAGLNTWQIKYDAIGGGLNFATEITDGHFVTLTAVNLTAIPEPGTWLALSCLLGSGVLFRSRRPLRASADDR